MRKPSIPATAVADRSTQMILTAMKENIEIMTGARPGVGQLTGLASDATNAEIIAKINELVARLNFSGE